MADAVPATPVIDQITAVDVQMLSIFPLDLSVSYALRLTWASGKIEFHNGVIGQADFVSCLSSFCQAAPKRKFLQWLLDNGRESNMTLS